MIAHRPGRSPAALTALPGGSTGNGGKPPRAYPLDELDESHDNTLSCALCVGVIEPGEPMTYRADRAGGFMFFHPVCSLAPEALVGAS